MTIPTLSKWDLYDHARIMAAVNTAHGSNVFTAFDRLDPVMFERKLNALSASSPDPFSKWKGVYSPSWSPNGLATAIGSV